MIREEIKKQAEIYTDDVSNYISKRERINYKIKII